MSPTLIGIYVFVLSCFVGYHVIWGVTPALHTPLMAVTNAISAIIVVGGVLVAGYVGNHNTSIIQILGFLAVVLASINIFGGFVVTQRMLAMFKKKK
ncbi:MAG: pyridine nucleotide transhydrogenase [Proteobacteria bacterium SG_bin7]|nr:MAG: pyridine nucleotide transhydrogenase [Proteobacteria bacterium SG_bin7]